jgi:hypothetical protein
LRLRGNLVALALALTISRNASTLISTALPRRSHTPDPEDPGQEIVDPTGLTQARDVATLRSWAYRRPWEVWQIQRRLNTSPSSGRYHRGSAAAPLQVVSLFFNPELFRPRSRVGGSSVDACNQTHSNDAGACCPDSQPTFDNH